LIKLFSGNGTLKGKIEFIYGFDKGKACHLHPAFLGPFFPVVYLSLQQPVKKFQIGYIRTARGLQGMIQVVSAPGKVKAPQIGSGFFGLVQCSYLHK
jgi:hypothetical protein